MPAHSEYFPWPSYYGHFDFFEQRMRSHNRVRNLENLGDGRYRLTKTDGSVLEVFVCECYSFGAAEYLETTSNLGRLDAIIISSNWCGYTVDAKAECRRDRVGLFDIRDFMAALNRRDFWTYLSDWDQERLRKRGLL
ncbi:hypothetical protein [Sphingosinicella sp.]|uniref:hypothetical protein n=1 Tax=Sphingosinicella sp. TaxID=1917971 RepID=UPI004037D7F2